MFDFLFSFEKKKLKYSNGDKLLVAQLAFVTTAVWKIKHCTLLHLPLFATCAYSSCGWSAMASAPSDAELRTATCPRGSRRCRASGWPAAHRFPQIIEGPQGGSPCDQVLLHSKPKWGLGWVVCLFLPRTADSIARSPGPGAHELSGLFLMQVGVVVGELFWSRPLNPSRRSTVPGEGGREGSRTADSRAGGRRVPHNAGDHHELHAQKRDKKARINNSGRWPDDRRRTNEDSRRTSSKAPAGLSW